MAHDPKKYDTGGPDDVAHTGNHASQDKNQKGAVDNKSKHTNEPANIEPAGKSKP